jgi:hypothetical protein
MSRHNKLYFNQSLRQLLLGYCYRKTSYSLNCSQYCSRLQLKFDSKTTVLITRPRLAYDITWSNIHPGSLTWMHLLVAKNRPRQVPRHVLKSLSSGIAISACKQSGHRFETTQPSPFQNLSPTASLLPVLEVQNHRIVLSLSRLTYISYPVK